MSKFKFASLFVAFALVLTLVGGVSTASAQTSSTDVASLQALIASLQAQIAALSGGASAPVANASFTRDLTIGSRGDDVTALQTLLESKGMLMIPAGTAKGYFGTMTKAALAKYQASVGLPATGYFGPLTRGQIASSGASVPTPGTTPTTPSTPGTLQGGSGSLDSVDYVSKLSNEEVGEGQSDVQVAGLEIEADDSSDIEIAAVTLNFSQGTAASDFDKYADEVSVWFEGKEVARLDADEFQDDDNFDKTVSLKSGAIIRGGQTGDLVVAISGINNLDSDDADDTWTVEFESVRYRDAQGAVVTDSETGDINDATGRTFSFVDFAAAADIELKVSKGEDDINDARTIPVDADDDSDNVDILSFEVEAEGDSDIDIDDISVDFTSVGAGVGEIINTAKLIVDGDIIGSETVSSTTATSRTITFDSLDWTVKAGDTVTVTVQVDVNDLDGGFTDGDTLSADVNPDDAAWDAEDEEGNDLAAGDKSGSAASDTHTMYSAGVMIAVESTESSIKDLTSDATGGERGVYVVKFKVTAFEDDIYLPFGATAATSSVDTDDAAAYAIEDSNGIQPQLNGAGLASTTASLSSSADTSGNYFVVREGDSETFTLTVELTPLADGFFRTQFYGVNYNVGSADSADTLQVATPANNFETDYENLDA